jgi:hypothetical protein
MCVHTATAVCTHIVISETGSRFTVPMINFQLARFAMRREVPGRIAMQPEKNPIRGLLGNYVFSDRPNLQCDLGSGAASRCVPSTRVLGPHRGCGFRWFIDFFFI